MSIMNIQSGMNSFNHNYLVSNRKKSKKADEHEGTMLNGDGLVGYNIDLLNGREHLTIENLNHEIIGVESNLSLVQTAACALQSLENQLSNISNFVWKYCLTAGKFIDFWYLELLAIPTIFYENIEKRHI